MTNYTQLVLVNVFVFFYFFFNLFISSHGRFKLQKNALISLLTNNLQILWSPDRDVFQWVVWQNVSNLFIEFWS